MKELYAFCEGPTEQGFCNQVLAPHLFPQFDGRIHTIRVANSRNRGTVSRGGVQRYTPLKRDITNCLKSRGEPNVFFTTLIDLYALPEDFPGKADRVRDPRDPVPYIVGIESAFGSDIADRRFLPHIQLHEFETMLFADPDALRIAFDDCDPAIAQMKRIAGAVATIELIDDGVHTAPSKRIIELLPAYAGRKVSAGPDIVEFIGIATVRSKCPHFDRWLTNLENLDWTGSVAP